MTPKWLHHFGFQSLPFTKQTEAQDLWMPSSRMAIVDEIATGLHERQHVLLVGDQGVGKTCVARAVRQKLPTTEFELTYCHNATLGRRDFYRSVCTALRLPTKATAAAVFHTITDHVETLGRERVHPIFLLDEAHLLHQDVLQHLHILTNFAWDSRPLLSLALIGLPELWTRLSLGKNRSLWSRIHTRVALGEATPEDTVEYVQHRLKAAGSTQPVFSADALAILHEATAGRLRDIDRLAVQALKRTARKRIKIVDGDILTAVAQKDQSPCQ